MIAAHTMQPGTSLGPYRIESLIGAGGMGEVYRAVDTRLDRKVAIKVLSADVSQDRSRRDRFDREARLISKLNHPGICAIYDVGRDNDVDYIVMEYLQGETLAERIRKGPLPVEQVARIGGDIANALERAHRQGIIHRDLKPGNVMLTPSGVKLLDFGLARLSAGPDLMGDASESTLHMPPAELVTGEGVIQGTLPYMAPEQLEGHTADRRSDIFALGAILYEMATGRRAFPALSQASVIAAIMESEPPSLASLQPQTPASLDRIVRACLRKDPDERFQTAHDVALELSWIAESANAVSDERKSERGWKTPLLLTIASLSLLALLASLWLFTRNRGVAPQKFALTIVPPAGLTFSSISQISPDGKSLAFIGSDAAGHRGLWLRRLDESAPQLLAQKPPIASTTIAWSPDSAFVAFADIAGMPLTRVPAAGGNTEKIADSNVFGGVAWLKDASLVFSPNPGAPLHRLSATGDLRPIAKLDAARHENLQIEPIFVTADRYVYLSYTRSADRSRIYAASLDGSVRKFVADADALVGFVEPHLLFVRDGAIYAQRFDTRSLSVSGPARAVINDISYREPDLSAFASVSTTGVVAYRPYNPSGVRFSVYDRSGKLLKKLWSDTDMWQDDELADVRVSRDGATLLLNANQRSKGAPDVVIVDLARGVPERLTGGLETNRNSVFSPDGRQFAFASDREGFYDIYTKPVDSNAAARPLWNSRSDKHVTDWSPDGKNLLVEVDELGLRSIWAAPVNGAPPWRFVKSGGFDRQAQFSPDGNWVAYSSYQNGQSDVYVTRFPSGPTTRISSAGGQVPTWSSDGKDILFSTTEGDVMSARVAPANGALNVSPAAKLFTIPAMAQAPRFMPDGTILVGEPEGRTPIVFNVDTTWRSKAP